MQDSRLHASPVVWENLNAAREKPTPGTAGRGVKLEYIYRKQAQVILSRLPAKHH